MQIHGGIERGQVQLHAEFGGRDGLRQGGGKFVQYVSGRGGHDWDEPAAARAHRQVTGQRRLRGRREPSGLLVPDVLPGDLAVAAQRVGEPVQRIPPAARTGPRTPDALSVETMTSITVAVILWSFRLCHVPCDQRVPA